MVVRLVIVTGSKTETLRTGHDAGGGREEEDGDEVPFGRKEDGDDGM